jgi:cytochrome P450
MLIRSFTAKRIAALRPRIQHIVRDRLDAMLAAGRSADLLSAFALPVSSMVICELLGVPHDDHEFFETQSRLRLDQEQAANYDPAFVEHPDEFDIRRSARGNLAFGYGIHQCLGANLARAEMEIAFHALCTRVPTLRLAVAAAQITPKEGILVGVTELPVAW